MLNFILLALSAFVIVVVTRRLIMGQYYTTFSAHLFVFGFIIGWFGVFASLVRIFNVQ